MPGYCFSNSIRLVKGPIATMMAPCSILLLRSATPCLANLAEVLLVPASFLHQEDTPVRTGNSLQRHRPRLHMEYRYVPSGSGRSAHSLLVSLVRRTRWSRP